MSISEMEKKKNYKDIEKKSKYLLRLINIELLINWKIIAQVVDVTFFVLFFYNCKNRDAPRC